MFDSASVLQWFWSWVVILDFCILGATAPFNPQYLVNDNGGDYKDSFFGFKGVCRTCITLD